MLLTAEGSAKVRHPAMFWMHLTLCNGFKNVTVVKLSMAGRLVSYQSWLFLSPSRSLLIHKFILTVS